MSGFTVRVRILAKKLSAITASLILRRIVRSSTRKSTTTQGQEREAHKYCFVYCDHIKVTEEQSIIRFHCQSLYFQRATGVDPKNGFHCVKICGRGFIFTQRLYRLLVNVHSHTPLYSSGRRISRVHCHFLKLFRKHVFGAQDDLEQEPAKIQALAYSAVWIVVTMSIVFHTLAPSCLSILFESTDSSISAPPHAHVSVVQCCLETQWWFVPSASNKCEMWRGSQRTIRPPRKA